MRLVNRLSDMDTVTEGEPVMVGIWNDREEMFYSRASRESLPFVFGGFMTLKEETRQGKRVIVETRYAFNVKGYLSDRREEIVYGEETPRFRHYVEFLSVHKN